MPSYVLSDSERDFYKEAYIRRLHKDGYPATKELLMKFNQSFCDDCGLQGEERKSVRLLVKAYNGSLNKRKNPGLRLLNRKPELREIFSAVLADYQQKRGAPDDQGDDSKQEDGSDLEEDVDLEQKQLINDLDDVMADKDGAIAVLENRNEELAITLKMKDEECQQLEEKVRSLEETLQKKSEKQAQQLKKSNVVKLENEKRSLEEKCRSLEEALQKKSAEKVLLSKNSDMAKIEEEKRSLEEEVRSLKEMLKTASKVQDVLTSFINKPVPQ